MGQTAQGLPPIPAGYRLQGAAPSGLPPIPPGYSLQGTGTPSASAPSAPTASPTALGTFGHEFGQQWAGLGHSIMHPIDAAESLVKMVAQPGTDAYDAYVKAGGGIKGLAAGAIAAIDPTKSPVIQAMQENPDHPYAAVAGMLTGQGAMIGATEGAARALPAVVPDSVTPEGLYTKALKPSTVASPAERAAMVQTGLNNAIPVNTAGLARLSGLIDDVNAKIADTVQADPTRPINPAKAVQNLKGVRAKFAQQVNPSGDVQAVDAAGNEFLDQLRNGQGGAVRNMDAADAQAMKQGTYRALGSKAYGEVKGASIEAQKALARGLKEELANQFPELATLNAQDSALLNLQPALERAVARVDNHNTIGIGTPLVGIGGAAVTGSGEIGGGLALMKALIDNPGFKSRLAIAMHQGSRSALTVAAARARIAAYATALGDIQQQGGGPQ